MLQLLPKLVSYAYIFQTMCFATADPEYIIYPASGASKTALENLIFAHSLEIRDVYASQRSGYPLPEFWTAPLNKPGFDVLRKSTLVRT